MYFNNIELNDRLWFLLIVLIIAAGFVMVIEVKKADCYNLSLLITKVLDG